MLGAFILVGCTGQRTVAFRGSPLIPAGVAVSVGIDAKPAVKPSLQNAIEQALVASDITVDDGAAGVLTVQVKRWERSADADRVIFESTSSAGGPMARQRQLFLAPPYLCDLSADLRRPDGSNLTPAAVAQARVHAHPDPTARRTQGRFLLEGSEEIEPMIGDDADLLAAAMTQAAERLVADLVTQGPAVELPLRDEPGATALLDQAVSGDLEAALEGLLDEEGELSADRLYNIGVIFDAMGRHREALDLYGQSLALKPDNDLLEIIKACEIRAAGQVVADPI